MRRWLLAALTLVATAPLAAIQGAARVESGPSATPRTSAALRDLPVSLGPPPLFESAKAKDRINPRADEPDQGRRGTWNRAVTAPDPLAARGLDPAGRTPTAFLSFEGTSNPTGCSGCTPPDTIGDVGPHDYVQIVNASKVTIYDKAGNLLSGPTDLSTLWRLRRLRRL